MSNCNNHNKQTTKTTTTNKQTTRTTTTNKQNCTEGEGDLLEGGSIRREVSCGSKLLRKSAQALSRVCRGKKSAMIISEPFLISIKETFRNTIIIKLLMANFCESLLRPFRESGLLPSLLILSSSSSSPYQAHLPPFFHDLFFSIF